MNEEVCDICDRLGLDVNVFGQLGVLPLARNPFSSVWTTVYQVKEGPYDAPSVFSCLSNLELEEEILGGTDWIRHVEDFDPGFCVTGDEILYGDGRDEGFDYLVKEVYFHSLERAQLHVSQEFVFLFGLLRGDDGNYYAVDECGREEMVVEVGDGFAMFRTKYLMRYIAAKQMLYVQFVDSRVASSEHYPLGAKVVCDEDCREASCHYGIWFQSTRERDYLLSMMYARSIVRPQDVSTCGVWPYDEESKEDYPEFIVEELPDGSFRHFSCDPDRVGNYFGANPGAPHYLTPVYFSPSVLDRYRDDPHFEVTERRLSCGTQWGVEIDVTVPSRVMLYLGDLGRDLPASERAHFLAHEISPSDQSVSATALAQDFFNSFDAPMGPVTAFLEARKELDEAWEEKFGNSLFRTLHPDEGDMEKLVYIPSGNGRRELDSVILNLTKLCVDYIDESRLERADSPGGINRLKATLEREGVKVSLSPLRDLQSIRSASMAHAKGSKYEKLKGSLLTGDNPADIERLVGRLTAMMSELAAALREGGGCFAGQSEEMTLSDKEKNERRSQ